MVDYPLSRVFVEGYVGPRLLHVPPPSRPTRRSSDLTLDGGVIRHGTRMSSSISSVAAGGVLMSARDVPAWAAALWSGKLLSPASLALMQTPVTLTSGRSCFYNMGWFIDALPNGAAYLDRKSTRLNSSR